MNNFAAYRSELTYKAIQPVMNALFDVDYSIIKGEALSFIAYREVGMRNSLDVDILVPRNNIRIFENKLIEYGFQKLHSDAYNTREERAFMLSNSHQTTSFQMQKSIFRLIVDLNFDIFWGEYTGKRVDIGKFISDATELDVYGVKVKTLSPIKSLIQLILHHYKDMNSIYHS